MAPDEIGSPITHRPADGGLGAVHTASLRRGSCRTTPPLPRRRGFCRQIRCRPSALDARRRRSNRRACREPDLHARDRLTDRAAVTMRSSALRRAATRSRRGLWLRAASLPDAVDRIERGVFLSRDKLGDTPPTVVLAPKAGGHHPAVREGERPSLRKAQRGRAGDFGRAGHAGTAHLDLVRWCWRMGSGRVATKVRTAGRSSAFQAHHWAGICAN